MYVVIRGVVWIVGFVCLWVGGVEVGMVLVGVAGRIGSGTLRFVVVPASGCG